MGLVWISLAAFVFGVAVGLSFCIGARKNKEEVAKEEEKARGRTSFRSALVTFVE